MNFWDDDYVYESGTLIDADKILKFAYLTNDLNPIHIIDSIAVAAGFERAIAHGMLVASFISTALSDHFGEGTIYVSQDVKFVRPVLVDSWIAIKLQNPVVNEKGRIDVQSNIWVQTKKRKGGEDFFINDLVVMGKAQIIPGNKNYQIIVR